MCKRVSIFMCLLFIPFLSFSQPNFLGTIRDSFTNEAIAFAYIYFNNNEVRIADELGSFAFSRGQHEVKISAIGYEEKTLELSSNDTLIYLSPKIYLLPEVTMRPHQTRQIEIGTLKKRKVRHTFFSQGEGYQVAKFISNDNEIEGTIKSISFYLTYKIKNSQKIRLLLISRDSVKLEPKYTIIPKSKIVNIGRKKGWVEVDVSDLQLAFPKEGFYVGLEFLTNKDKIDMYDELHFGLIPFEKEALTWVKYLGSEWNIPPFLNHPEVGQLNLMVKIKMEVITE